MTLDLLYDLLVQRFQIQPPDSLEPDEVKEWRKFKQHVIQIRWGLKSYALTIYHLHFNDSVLDTFKSMIVNEGVLKKDDMHILDRIREFLLKEEVWHLEAAKSLLSLTERSVCVKDFAGF